MLTILRLTTLTRTMNDLSCISAIPRRLLDANLAAFGFPNPSNYNTLISGDYRTNFLLDIYLPIHMQILKCTHG